MQVKQIESDVTNEAAKRMYEKFGFVETERDGDEIVMERAL